MLALPAGARVHLALGVTDMRKGSDGLAAQVQTALKEDPFSGHLGAAEHLLEHRHRLQAGCGPQHGDDLRLPHLGERIGAAAAAGRAALRQQPGVRIEARRCSG